LRNFLTELFLLLGFLVVVLLVGHSLMGRFSDFLSDVADEIRKLFAARRMRTYIGKDPSRDRLMAMIVAIRTAQRHYPSRKPENDPDLSRAEALIRDQLNGLGEDALREVLEGLIQESHYLWLQIALETLRGGDASR
jgi:hypothetical protein